MAGNEQTDQEDFNVPKDYDRREGTIDYGKEYEVRLTTLFAVLSANSDDDMWIASNVNDCGDFDDIVLHRKIKAGSQVTIMMQLKHEEKGKHLTQQQFFSLKGNFSLQRYSRDLSSMQQAIDDATKQTPIIKHLRLNHEKIFIIFTNKGVFEYDFLAKVEEGSNLNIFNISGNISKFCYDGIPSDCRIEENSKEFMNNLFLFTKQSPIQELNKSITNAMEKLLEPLELSEKSLASVIEKFTTFVDDWSKGHLGGYYPLTKTHIMKVLATLLLEQYEAEFKEREEGGVFETTGAWNEIINTKLVAVVDADRTTVQFVNQHVYKTVSKFLESSDMIALWERNRKLVNKTMLKVVPRHKQINLYDLYEYLWKSLQVPLVLQASDPLSLKNLQLILKMAPGAFRVIILTKIGGETPQLNLPNMFMNLLDLNEEYQQVILQLPVKLQGRPCDALHTLVSAELYQFVTVKDIIYILLGNYNIGKFSEALPEFFVDRSIPKVFIKGKALEKVKNDLFIVKCATSLKFKKFRKKHKLRGIRNSTTYQKHQTEIDAHILNKFRIIVSNKDINLENISSDSFGNKTIHYLVLYNSHNLEWKKSFGSINALRPYRLANYTPIAKKKEIFKSYDDDTSYSSSGSSDSESENSGTEDSESDDKESDDRESDDIESEDSDSEIIKQVNNMRFRSKSHRQVLNRAAVKNNLKTYRAKEMLALFSSNCNGTPLIISADPGMGKSVLMDYIAINMSLTTWVVRINLIQHITYYKREDFKNLKSEDHLHYFNNEVLVENEISYAMLKKYQEMKNILFLFDGFDEIPIVSRQNVIKTVKSLYDSGYLTCLTTRPVAKIQLEDVFNTFAVDIVPFSETNQITFLIEYFKTFVKSDMQNKMVLIKQFVEKLLNTSKTNFNAFDSKFMGVPLQTKLLAEVFTNDCETFLCTGTFGIEHFDILYLYKNFINKKVKIICDKFGESSEDEYMRYINYRSLLALQLIFEDNDLEELDINKQLQLLYEMFPHTLQEVQKDGIVIAESEINIGFAHRTFAEYLSAQWLSENINGKYKNLVQSLVQKLFQPNYNSVRNLYDRIVAQDCAEHLLVLNKCINQVVPNILSNPNIWNEIDKCGRTLLHLMAFGGVQHPYLLKSPDELKSIRLAVNTDLIVKCFNTRTIEINNIQDSLGFTPLDYALFSRCYGTANAMCKRVQNVNHCIISNSADFELIYDYLINNHFNYRPLTRVLFKNVVLADINTAITKVQHTKDDSNELHFAIVRNFENMQSLLTLAINIDVIDDSGYTPLHIAVMLKRKETVSLLLSKVVNVNVPDKSGKTALHWASALGDIDSVNLLLSKTANVDVIDNNGMTPLHYAVTLATHDQKGIVTMLLDNKAAINIRDDYGNTALQYCVYYSHAETLEAVINYLTQRNNPRCTSIASNVVQAQDYPINLDTLLSNSNDNGETIFHWAADCNVTSLLFFFKNHLEFSAVKNSKGNTPLHFAAMRGNAESVKLLLENNSASQSEKDRSTTINMDAANSGHTSSLNGRPVLHDTFKMERCSPQSEIYEVKAEDNENYSLLHIGVDTQNNKNTTALHIAAKNGDLDIATILLSKGADVNTTDSKNWTALHLAARYERVDVVSLLLCKGADVNAKTDKHMTALHFAAKRGCLDMILLLLDNGADVDAESNKKCVPLYLATKCGHLDIVTLLLSWGANVNAKSNANWTALHAAASHEHLDILAMLLSNAADVDVQTNKKRTTPLHYAVKRGRLDMVSLLLSKQATIDKKNYHDCTALHLAAKYEQFDIIETLLSNGADVAAENSRKRTALHLAVRHGHLDTVLLLLAKGADVNAKSAQNWTALHGAARFGYSNMLSVLVSKGADVDAKTNKNATALHFASRFGYLDMVSVLLANGADVNSKTNKNWTMLHFAAKWGNINMASLFLSKSIDVNAKNNQDYTALHLAARYGHLSMVRVLLSKGADLHAKTGSKKNTVLHLAARYGYLEIVSLLLSKGADIVAKSHTNWTALHSAAYFGHLDVVSSLLSKGADVNAKNNKTYSALHFAARCGHLDVVSSLLSKGADVNAKNNKMYTALHFAARYGELDIVSLLLFKGAEVNAKSYKKITALHFAVRCRHSEMVSLFLTKGADTEAMDDAGRTTLHIAAKYGHSVTISLLLDNGADIEAKSNESCTPLHVAAASRKSDVLSILLTRGANIEAVDNHCRTALHIAILNGRFNSVSLLLSNKAKINAKDDADKTAFHYAAKRGDIRIVLLLLDEGADVPQNDEDDYTELYNAVVKADLDAAQSGEVGCE